MHNKPGRPLKFKSSKKLEIAIEDYFEWCEKNKIPPTLSRLAVHIGISRDTLVTYSHKEQFSDTIKKAKERVEAAMEERMLMGQISTTGAIFALKNNFGWKDRMETENVNMNKNYDFSHLSTEEIRELLKSED